MAAFTDAAVVALVLAQILRAATEKQFEIIAYCFMPDHLHLVVEGMADGSDLKAFAKLAKQYSGYYYARTHGGGKLWQRYGHDRIVRDEADLRDRVRYVANNPVAAGLVDKAEDYPFLGSQRWSLEALLDYCRGAPPKRDLPARGSSA
jgi:putative transposase